MKPSPSDYHQFLQSRRSIRRYRRQAVPAPVIERILETAARAPSAHNRQPWRFAVVTTEAAKTKLAEAMGIEFARDLQADGLQVADIRRQVDRSHERIMGAPVVIVLNLTMAGMDAYPDRARRRAEFRMALQSVALAGGQLLLAAHAEGLGAVWVCGPLFAQKAVQKALELPTGWEPQAMLLVGYPERLPPARERKAIASLTVYR